MVFKCSEQRFDVRVVVAGPGPAVRHFDVEALQERHQRDAFHRMAVIGMKRFKLDPAAIQHPLEQRRAVLLALFLMHGPADNRTVVKVLDDVGVIEEAFDRPGHVGDVPGVDLIRSRRPAFRWLAMTMAHPRLAPMVHLICLPKNAVKRVLRGQIPPFRQQLWHDLIGRLVAESRFVTDADDLFSGVLWHFSDNGFHSSFPAVFQAFSLPSLQGPDRDADNLTGGVVTGSMAMGFFD